MLNWIVRNTTVWSLNCVNRLLELLVVHSKTKNHLTVQRRALVHLRMLSTKFVYKSHIYLIYVYKEDLALYNLQWLICHKTKQINWNLYTIFPHRLYCCCQCINSFISLHIKCTCCSYYFHHSWRELSVGKHLRLLNTGNNVMTLKTNMAICLFSFLLYNHLVHLGTEQ